METYTELAPLELLRFRRLVNARETQLNAHVDPLRRLIRRRNEQIGEILRRLKQVREMRKGGGIGPTGDCWGWGREHGETSGRPGERTTS